MLGRVICCQVEAALGGHVEHGLGRRVAIRAIMHAPRRDQYAVAFAKKSGAGLFR